MSYAISDITEEITKRLGIYNVDDTYYQDRAEILFLQALLSLAMSTDEAGQNKIPYEDFQPMIEEEQIDFASIIGLEKIGISTASSATKKLTSTAEKIITLKVLVEDDYMRKFPLTKEEGEEFYLNTLTYPQETVELFYWFDEKDIVLYANIDGETNIIVTYIKQISGYGTDEDFVSDLGFSEIFLNMAIDIATESLKREWSNI